MADYRIYVRAQGFKTQIVEGVRLEVARKTAQNFQLQIGDVSEEIVVTPTINLIEQATISVGRTFFFFAYEGLRQNQAVNLNTVVLSDQQRFSVADPVIKNLST